MFLGDVGNSVLSPVTSKVLSCVYAPNQSHIFTNGTIFPRLPDAKNLRSSIHAVLWSSRPNDAISGELVDLVGFDNIEMVAELIANREVVTQEVIETAMYLLAATQSNLSSLLWMIYWSRVQESI